MSARNDGSGNGAMPIGASGAGAARRTGRGSSTLRSTILWGLALVACAAPLRAQSLADRISGTDDGTVVFRFAARPGVCGDAHGMIHTGESMRIGDWTAGEDWRGRCVDGPVRVALRIHDGRVVRLSTTVGPEPDRRERPPVTDLGAVAPADAVDYLLRLARVSRREPGGDALLPATLADGAETWPELLAIARDANVRRDTRKQATFWVGMAAADAVTDGLSEMAANDDVDLEVRKQAVFALSRRPNDEGVPALIDVVRREDLHPEIRRSALFWLGRTNDPRALDVFEEILLDEG